MHYGSQHTPWSPAEVENVPSHKPAALEEAKVSYTFHLPGPCSDAAQHYQLEPAGHTGGGNNSRRREQHARRGVRVRPWARGPGLGGSVDSWCGASFLDSTRPASQSQTWATGAWSGWSVVALWAWLVGGACGRVQVELGSAVVELERPRGVAVICELRRGSNEKGVGLLRGSFKEEGFL